eukprot:351733-Chlamydomonas_euryale.AAC.6
MSSASAPAPPGAAPPANASAAAARATASSCMLLGWPVRLATCKTSSLHGSPQRAEEVDHLARSCCSVLAPMAATAAVAARSGWPGPPHSAPAGAPRSRLQQPPPHVGLHGYAHIPSRRFGRRLQAPQIATLEAEAGAAAGKVRAPRLASSPGLAATRLVQQKDGHSAKAAAGIVAQAEAEAAAEAFGPAPAAAHSIPATAAAAARARCLTTRAAFLFRADRPTAEASQRRRPRPLAAQAARPRLALPACC